MPEPTGALRQEVLHLGPLDNNTYIIYCPRTREAALLDVGFEAPRAVDAVRRLELSVRYLLNTHAHYDHAAAMAEAQELLGGDYYLHPADRPLLSRLGEQGAAFGFPPASAPPIVHDLADGQEITVGEARLRVIHTPGHSPGGVCFHSGSELWVGDTLFAGSVGRTDLPGGSFDQLRTSIRERLFPLGEAVSVRPGHGPPTTLGEERRSNPFVGDRATWG